MSKTRTGQCIKNNFSRNIVSIFSNSDLDLLDPKINLHLCLTSYSKSSNFLIHLDLSEPLAAYEMKKPHMVWATTPRALSTFKNVFF